MDRAHHDEAAKLPVPDFEALSRNMARFVEEAGKATAAYLKPVEEGRANTGLADDVGDMVKILGKVADDLLRDPRSEEHTSELQSRQYLVCRLLLEKKMLAYQQKESTARVASIMENTNLSKQQQVSESMRQMLTQAQTAGQYFTNDQIKEMTRKVSAEVDLGHQQTQNQQYGSSHIGATAKFFFNVVPDPPSSLLVLSQGIDK